jgi:phosphatidylglycerophosphate synthase
MHLPIAWLIATGRYNTLAAVLLIVFGLFDVLDGELARLQGSARASGMLLDASTDRIKETALYAGAAYALAATSPKAVVWAVIACGSSLCVSYVKAKGEAALASSRGHMSHAELNRIFKDGLLTFEFRMTALIVGLLIHQLLLAVIFIALLASFTTVQRLVRIMKALQHVQS